MSLFGTEMMLESSGSGWKPYHEGESVMYATYRNTDFHIQVLRGKERGLSLYSMATLPKMDKAIFNKNQQCICDLSILQI